MLHPTIDKLRRLRLIGMAKALEEQLAQPDSERLSFDERLGILVDREEVDRQNAALAQRLPSPDCARRRAWRTSTTGRPGASIAP